VRGGTDPRAYEALRERALAILKRREHGVRELEEKLVAPGADRALARAVIEDLAARDLVSDERYAAAYARAAARRRPRAEGRIVAELVERRVPAATAARAVRRALADEGVDDRTLARAVAERSAARSRGLPAATRWARLDRSLRSRGFAPDLCVDVCAEVLESVEDDEDC
jgi:regulatory protein